MGEVDMSDIRNEWELLPPGVRNQLYLMAKHLSEFAMSLNQSSFQRYGHLCEIKQDGDQWCVLLGENIQEGVVGYGDTPNEAITAFDNAMNNQPEGSDSDEQ